MSEITHIVCAHCGRDNVVSNAVPSDGTLSLVFLANSYAILFKCCDCEGSYPLPITLPSGT